MYLSVYKKTWYCRWDGKTYTPENPTDRDGFCCPACKQALYRARKTSKEFKEGKRRKRGKYKKSVLPKKQGNVKLKTGRKNKRNTKKIKYHKDLKRAGRTKQKKH